MPYIGGVGGIVVLAIWLYAIYDVITTDESLVRNLPKGIWLLLVIFLGIVGSLAWLLLGRPQSWEIERRSYGGGYAPPDRLRRVGPARESILDDPSYEHLSPEVREREERARLRVWEEQLRRREEELRRKQTGIGPPKQEDDDLET